MNKGASIAIVAIVGISIMGSGVLASYQDNNYNWFENFSNILDLNQFMAYLTGAPPPPPPPPPVDQSPIDHASIALGVGIRPIKHDGQPIFQNIVDECVFHSEDDFSPLCIKCYFLNDANPPKVVAYGEKIEDFASPLGYEGSTQITIPMSSEPKPKTDEDAAANGIDDVENVKLELCGPQCVPVFADFTKLKHGSNEDLINPAMAPFGISVSAVAIKPGGYDEVIIFDGDTDGGPNDTNLQPDPDLRGDGNTPDLNFDDGICPLCVGKHILIIAENLVGDNDDIIDIPDDSAKGGTISITMTTPRFLKSFVLVDLENNAGATAKAYDSANNLIGSAVPLPNTGNGGVATVPMNKANVKRLDVTYYDSGGITNIDLKCEPPEQNCVCEKPDKFTVKYNGPTMDKVVISGNQGSFTINGPITDGSLIVVTGAQLGTPNGKMPPNTTYDFYKYNIKKGTITIHTSCSQPLYIGQMFTTQGISGLIKLTVIDGTINGKTSIPDASCPIPPPPPPSCIECQKPDKFTVNYMGPSFDKVIISNQDKDPVTLNGPFPGNNIVVDAIALGFKNGKVNPNTTYDFIKNHKSIGKITIHTSCSQPLFVGQMFFYKQGMTGEIKLTVVSGTLKGVPSIPASSSCYSTTSTTPPTTVTPKVIFSTGFEDSTELSNWKFDLSRSGVTSTGPQKLEILSTNTGDPAVAHGGTKYLGGTGNFVPKFAAYNRSIDVFAYHGVQISLWHSAEDTEAEDSFALYYKDGLNWVPIKEIPSSEISSGETQTSWKNVIKSIPDSVDTLVIQFRWFTSTTNEHMMLDDIQVTGIPN